MSQALDVISVIAFLCTGVVAVVCAIIYARQKAIRLSLASFVEANGELRQANNDLRTELANQKLVHAREVAELKGRLDAVTSHMADQIVNTVAAALARMAPTLSTGAPQ